MICKQVADKNEIIKNLGEYTHAYRPELPFRIRNKF